MAEQFWIVVARLSRKTGRPIAEAVCVQAHEVPPGVTLYEQRHEAVTAYRNAKPK